MIRKPLILLRQLRHTSPLGSLERSFLQAELTVVPTSRSLFWRQAIHKSVPSWYAQQRGQILLA